MSEITPRWEWRSFGQRFGEAGKRLAALTPGGVQESDELYLLSGAGANVKIRADLMDIKVLREVSADGLEQWTPVMKAGFPLPAAEAAKVLEALGLPLPTPIPASYTLDEFLGSLPRRAGNPRGERPQAARSLHGRRLHGRALRRGGEGQARPHAAVESEDAAGVMRAVRELGLGGYANTSYPADWRPLIDDEPERYAVIDAGTNSIKFHIGEHDAGGNGEPSSTVRS